MKTFILLFLIIHTTTAIVDLQNIKNTVATKLHMLQENAATNLKSFQEQATTGLQSFQKEAASKIQAVQEQATQSFQQFADSIDYDKLQKLDILHILPVLETKGKLITKAAKAVPEYKKKVKLYLQTIKSLTGQDLVMAFDVDTLPWPVKRMDDKYYNY